MKPAYRCDYCNKIGSEEEIREHESECLENYHMKSCYTCKYAKFNGIEDMVVKYKCKNGIDIPTGYVYQSCASYERAGENDSIFPSLLNGWF